jgi:two-component system, OmpR family, response regulator
MFIRAKQVGSRTYLQLVRNEWCGGKTQQTVVATLGRLDKMLESGELLSILRSGTKFVSSSINYIDRDRELLSTHRISRLLEVSPNTVIGWTDSGRLRSVRTSGGHRRVRPTDLRDFLVQSRLPLPPELQGGDGARRVFVVDDDALTIRAIQRSLAPYRDRGVEVDGCTDGVEALVLIGAEQPDLVLLDIHMEGIDGFEICRRLNRLERPARFPVVAITAFPSAEDRSRMLNYGALDYWVKPIDPEAVLRVLKVQEEVAGQGVA